MAMCNGNYKPLTDLAELGVFRVSNRLLALNALCVQSCRKGISSVAAPIAFPSE